MIGSTALTQIPELVNKPLETPNRLGYAIPSSAKFFLSYMVLRVFLTIPLRFLITQPGVWQAWIRWGGAGVRFVDGCGLANHTDCERQDHGMEPTNQPSLTLPAGSYPSLCQDGVCPVLQGSEGQQRARQDALHVSSECGGL